MATPVDLNEDDKIVNRHILLSEQLFDLIMKDAKQHTAGNLSMWLRMILRKHYKLPGKKPEGSH